MTLGGRNLPAGRDAQVDAVVDLQDDDITLVVLEALLLDLQVLESEQEVLREILVLVRETLVLRLPLA